MADPANADWTEALGAAQRHHQAGDRDAAERLYLQVLRAAPDHPTVLYLYGCLNLEAGRSEPAERLLGRVAELLPENAEAHVALANALSASGRQAQAIASYRKALAVQPGHAVATASLAALILERGFVDDSDFESGIEVCRAAIGMLADPAPAFAVLGRILLAAGRAAEAAQAYRSAIAAAPTNPGALSGLALALLAVEEREAALEAADAALALNLDLADAWFVRGSAALRLFEPRAAADAFERGLALAPNQARLHIGLADARDELGQTDQALAHLGRALALDPASKAAHASLGSLLYRCGDLEAAERHCRAALALDPTLALVHRNLAGILADRGDAEAARQHRDASYRLCNLIVTHAAQPRRRVLVLTTSDSGNVPHRYLLPPRSYTRIDWFIEYASDGQAGELPPYDLVFNIIGDPDFADATNAPVVAFLEQCDRRVLNDPAKVAPTRRDRLPGLLDGIEGLVVPKVLRLGVGISCDLPSAVAAADLAYPLLIRPIGSHGGRRLTLAHTPADLAAAGAADGLYATEFVDFRTPDDGLFRKYRMIFVDRVPYPYHLAIAGGWLVHYVNADMSGAAAHQAEELRFLEDPVAVLGEAAMTAVAAIGRRLELDYAGVDFGVLPDDRVLVFEANATMLVHPEPPDGEFAYKNPFVERITAAFQALVERS